MQKPMEPLKGIGPGGIPFTLRPIGRTYQLRFTHPRTRRQVHAGTGTFLAGEARAFAAQYIQKYAVESNDPSKVTVGQLMDALLLEYGEGTRNHRETKRAWEMRVEPIFGNVIATDVKTTDIRDLKAYLRGQNVEKGLFQGIAPYPRKLTKGTIQRTLAGLSRAYNFAIKGGVIDQKPSFEKYKKRELNHRIGEVNIEEFDAVMAQDMPTWLRTYLQVSWDCGNRAGEPKKLRVGQFDGLGFQLAPGHEREDAATEKSGNGRWVPLSEAGIHLVKGMCSGKKADELIFTREDRKLGERSLGDFRKLWKMILAGAGIERKVLLHDFRRTAVTNLREAGVDEALTMEIVGHLTPEMNRLYRQTGRTRLIAAMRKKEAWERQQRGQANAPDQLAELQKQVEAGKAREAQMQAALTALQTAIANLNVGIAAGRETVATQTTQEVIQ